MLHHRGVYICRGTMKSSLARGAELLGELLEPHQLARRHGGLGAPQHGDEVLLQWQRHRRGSGQKEGGMTRLQRGSAGQAQRVGASGLVYCCNCSDSPWPCRAPSAPPSSGQTAPPACTRRQGKWCGPARAQQLAKWGSASTRGPSSRASTSRQARPRAARTWRSGTCAAAPSAPRAPPRKYRSRRSCSGGLNEMGGRAAAVEDEQNSAVIDAAH